VLTTPTVVFFEPFDVTKDYIVKFNYTGLIIVIFIYFTHYQNQV